MNKATPACKPDDADIRAAKDILVAWRRAMKNLALYPETNDICRQGLRALTERLNAFLDRNGALKIDVESDRLLLDGHAVHEEAPGDDALAGILYRDGIQTLQFEKGISHEEIVGLMRILEKYKTLHEDADGDLVTSLWDRNFPHLRYEASDVLWDAEALIDFSPKAALGPKRRTGEEQDPELKGIKSLAAMPMDHRFWGLTGAESSALKRMALAEENWNGMPEVLEMLTFILLEGDDDESFKAILDFLMEEFHEALRASEFTPALDILACLDRIKTTGDERKYWIFALTDDFFKEASRPEILGPAAAAIRKLTPGDAETLSCLHRLFLLLYPEAILTLAPALCETLDLRVEKTLLEVITEQASREIWPLTELIQKSDEDLIFKLVFPLMRLSGGRADEMLTELTGHASEKVRVEALKALKIKRPEMMDELFPHINDPAEAVRRLALDFLGERKNVGAEVRLMDYIEQKQCDDADDDQILACYETLGKCGSEISVPFLEKTLLDQPWRKLLAKDRSAAREGAALALKAMGGEAAEAVLEKGLKSRSLQVRQICRKVLGDRA